MRCFDKLSMTLYFYFNVSRNVLADLLMAEKQKIRNSLKFASDFSFCMSLQKFIYNNHEASQKVKVLLVLVDML